MRGGKRSCGQTFKVIKVWWTMFSVFREEAVKSLFVFIQIQIVFVYLWDFPGTVQNAKCWISKPPASWFKQQNDLSNALILIVYEAFLFVLTVQKCSAQPTDAKEPTYSKLVYQRYARMKAIVVTCLCVILFDLLRVTGIARKQLRWFPLILVKDSWVLVIGAVIDRQVGR